ncbi:MULTISPECIES: type II secretion system F family protein [Pseudidiomarina]|uniref:MSHA biogenesis protein MshG n=2 Tax=Pseudidiomarina TaxID=2800384 RepID=A0A368UTP7_9GAMM|nr:MULTISPECIES: type II secretion system F family protein [Pseudidiomarina]PWW13069.1 MSHA biogenesis protein MshG [Pseudidiomarina maritima]RBP90397.1 MSHA biogenesis protein MshG [Pseudidiomarina tainanensis]RCW32073.1 MSHA biogenesis protein MshG [Pseudidiomarina tainanensis]
MASYSYRGRDGQGQLVQGVLEASSENTAAEALLRRGITPIQLKIGAAANADKADKKSSNSLFQRKISTDDLIVFTRQMYALTKAGIPLLRAIQGLADNTSNRRLGAVLHEVVDQLERGRQLSSAMAAHPKVFPRLLVAIVHVGENTGQLEEAFMQLSEYLQKEQETRKQVKTALRYPTFIIITLVIAMFVLNIFVIPTFANMFSRFDVELPLSTRILIGTSNFFVNWWPALLLGIAVTTIAATRYVKTPSGEMKWDYFKVKLPLVGDIIFRSLLSRFSRSFAVMLKAGVPLTQGLSLVADAVDNRWMGKKINDMRRNIERGESLSRVSRSSELFTPLVLQMIQVGEETGRVDEMLHEVADYYEREVDYDLKSLTAKIEPIMLIVVAVMISVMALGIFTPMWDMMNAYKNR